MADEKSFPTLPTGPLPSGLVTFMFTDIVNSTKLKGLMPGETSSERQDNFHDQIKLPHAWIILASVQKRKGVIVEGTGDGFFITFPDAELGVLCGLEIQEQLKAANIKTPDGTLQVRIGLNSGTATPTGLGYTAGAADKAARVQSQAGSGLVYVSPETHGLVVGKVTTLAFADLGPVELKGLGPVTLWQAFRKDQNPNDAIADAYRQHLVDRFGKLTLYSLSSDQPIAVDLEQVFVKLTATQQSSFQAFTLRSGDSGQYRSSIWKFSAERIRELQASGYVEVKDKDELASLQKFLASESPEQIASQQITLSLPQALRAHPHLAIIGAPGAGKTTALKWLALAYSRRQVKERLELDEDRLPLFVALRDFNRFLDNLDGNHKLPGQLHPALLAEHLQDYYANNVQCLPLPPDFFLRALTTGQALVLLDGLDEVSVASKRTRAAEFVAACVRAYPKCRFVLSSRPRGYENDCRTHLAALCSECRVRDFDDDDIAAFSTNWYLAVTIAREGDNPTTRDRAASAAKNLQAAVKQERVRPLAANPLLLSILALIHQKGVGLPQRRVELYQECTEFLLGYWDQIRGGDTGHELAKLGGLTRQEKCALLEPIALWIHERGEKGTEVSRKELEAQLAEQFLARFGDSGTPPKQRAKEFVDIIEQRAGLIVEREQDTFAFTHLTFQEYLAARALSDREDFVEQTVKHLHDPWWREVHLLEVAHLSTPNTRRSREDTRRLLASMQGAGSLWESDLHRDLLFAFHALCDVSLLGIEPTFRTQLVQSILSLWWSTKTEPLTSYLIDRFSYAGGTPVGILLVESLLSKTEDENAATRSRAVVALSRLGSAAATSAVLTRLLELSQDTELVVRGQTAAALGNLSDAPASDKAFMRLAILVREPDQYVSGRAAMALGQFGARTRNSEVVAFLLRLTHEDSIQQRCNGVWGLSSMGEAAAIQAVLDRIVHLCLNHSAEVRSSAVGALESLGSAAATPKVFDRLLLLSQDKTAAVRRNAAEALGQLGTAAAKPEMIAKLIELSHDLRSDVRRNAAVVLGRFSRVSDNQQVLARLLALSQDRIAEVRSYTASALGHFSSAAANPEVIARLLALSRDYNSYVRRNAVAALGHLDSAAATPQVVAVLLAQSQDTNVKVRGNVVVALGQLGMAAATAPVFARLLELSQDENDNVRRTAAGALGQLGGAATTADIPSRLLTMMKDDSADVRRTAARALGQMAEALSPELTTSLTEWCQTNLANDRHEFFSYDYQQVSEVAFDILHRLAARMPRTAGAEGRR